MQLDMLSPRGLSGAPVIREDLSEVVGVVVGDRIIELAGESFRFGEALLLDALRSARSGDWSPTLSRAPYALRPLAFSRCQARG
jgi:hypothetical protein